MATKRKIHKVLLGLNLFYTHAAYSADGIEALVKYWDEDLHDIPDYVLDEAVSKVRRRSEFFPNTAQVRKEAEELLRKRDERPALPTHTSDQHIKIGQQRVREILSSLTAKKSMNS